MYIVKKILMYVSVMKNNMFDNELDGYPEYTEMMSNCSIYGTLFSP